MENGITVKGHLQILKNGVVVREVENLVVNYGLSLLAELLNGNTSIASPAFIGIGTGDNAPAATDTTLETEILRASCTKTLGTGSNANKLVFSKYWAPNSFVDTVQEAGIFDAASSGNMFNRAIFTAVNVGAIDTFAVVWTISFNAV